MFFIAWLLAWFGCSQQEETATADSCTTGEQMTLVITSLSYTLPDEQGLIDGFDLDQYATEMGDDEGCGHEDMVSPDGEEGIDSAWSRLAPVLDSIGASQIQDYLQAAIDAGNLLIVVELTGLDGPLDSSLNDDCAMLTIRRAAGAPLMGNDGTILSDQTFHLDDSIAPTNTVSVEIVQGEVTAHGVDMLLPAQLLDEYVTLILNQTSIRFSILQDGSFDGYLAGGLPVEALTERLAEIDDIGSLREVIPGMVSSAADLYPDGGVCTEISIGLDLTAKNSYLFDE